MGIVHPEFRRCLAGMCATSVLLNVWFFLQPFAGRPRHIPEQHLFGTAGVAERIAIVNFEGTISPPFTARWLKVLKQAREDDSVRGVVLVIDSPGGFVADSHQLYRYIDPASGEREPVYVAMKRIAASWILHRDGDWKTRSHLCGTDDMDGIYRADYPPL